jgi:hypothetical protein
MNNGFPIKANGSQSELDSEPRTARSASTVIASGGKARVIAIDRAAQSRKCKDDLDESE